MVLLLVVRGLLPWRIGGGGGGAIGLLSIFFKPTVELWLWRVDTDEKRGVSRH